MNRMKWVSLGIALCSALVGISRADEALEKSAGTLLNEMARWAGALKTMRPQIPA